MRHIRMVLLAGAAICAASPAFAADALKFGPPPPWVHVQKIPSAKATDAPVAVLLEDEQVAFDGGKVTTYTDAAVKVENSQGLQAGNLSLVWQPATDTVTVNKLHIIRDGKVIDVLAGGQTFTVLRRETNLDAATLDGTLTATIQPEGLQVGDIIDLATTIERSDPVLKGHVETMFAAWDGFPIQLAHATLTWPDKLHINVRETPNLPAPQKSSAGGMNVLELTGEDVQPLVPPKGAPERYQIGRLAEATDFGSWTDVANLVSPLFHDAAVIPASGPLHDEVEKIRSSSPDPKTRATQALALVQDRVRYVALLMGQGGYVPASAEQTWSRRFGDCKAKTALLLGILHSLGIEAEPVLVQAKAGDIVADRLPMIGLFNHVLVRAHIASKDYWLDGTRTGDTDLDAIQIPNFGWALPLVANAQLIHLVPKQLDRPSVEHHIAVDASAGVYAPAPITIEEVYRGDTAVGLNFAYSAVTAQQRDEAIHDKAKAYFDDFSVASSSFSFDKSKREFDLVIKGTAKLNWKDDWFDVPTSSIGFDPDFDRAAGPLHDVPLAIDYPRYVKDEAVVQLPAGFAAQQKLSDPVHETLAGVEYARTETVSGGVLTVDSSERSIAPEVPYKEAVAAEPQLRALSKNDVYLNSAVSYAPTDKDLVALSGTSPESAEDYVDRGNLFLNGHKFDEAIADYTKALTLDPKNKWAVSDRAIAYVWKDEFSEAQKDIDAALKRQPDDAVALRAQGLAAEFNGDCAKAITFYTHSLAAESDSSFSIGHRAICESRVSDYAPALADSARALRSDPSWLDLRLLRANIFIEQGNRAAAVHEAELGIADNPHSATAFVSAARIYNRLDMAKEVTSSFDRALAIKPSAYVYLSRAQSRPIFDKADRLEDVEQALKLEPDNSEALADKAFYLSETGHYAEAIAFYDRATKDDHSVEMAANRAIALYKLGKTAEAQKAFADLRTQAKTAVEFNDLCWIKATAGVLLDSALEECRDALKMSPGTGQFLDSLGMVLLKLGKTDEALDAYNQAVLKNVGASSLMGRAFVYLQKGEKQQAEADAARARKSAPDIGDLFVDYGLKWDDAPAMKASATASAHK